MYLQYAGAKRDTNIKKKKQALYVNPLINNTLCIAPFIWVAQMSGSIFVLY